MRDASRPAKCPELWVNSCFRHRLNFLHTALIELFLCIIFNPLELEI